MIENGKPPEAKRNSKALSPTLKFMVGVFKFPVSIGAIAPTSALTARRMIELSKIDDATEIIELGAGTGVLTREILARKSSNAKVMAVERSEAFAAMLTSLHPDLLVVNDCASKIKHYADHHGLQGADRIISALPWSMFPKELQRDILTEACGMLKPGGSFHTLVYFGTHWLPKGRSFRRFLKTIFAEVHSSPVMLHNLPPAFVYECKGKKY